MTQGEKSKNRIGKTHEEIFGIVKAQEMSRLNSEKHKGKIPWNKGLPWSEAIKKKVSDTKLKNPTKYWLGKKRDILTKDKISISRKGYPAWNKDKECPQFSGENHPNWLGGKSIEPYAPEFNKHLKKKIRDRDNNECILCRLSIEARKIELENSNLQVWQRILLLTKFEADKNRDLTVHHVDYDKKNSREDNLLTACRSHNAIFNSNREYWKTFLQKLMTEKYGYKYLEIKNEV